MLLSRRPDLVARRRGELEDVDLLRRVAGLPRPGLGQLDLGQAAVSQHLAALRNVGLVEATRDGRSVRYQLADPQILDACGLMRDVIVRRLSALGSLAAAATQEPFHREAAPAGLDPLTSQVTHR
jgi:ArsR family transcriptional regulator